MSEEVDWKAMALELERQRDGLLEELESAKMLTDEWAHACDEARSALVRVRTAAMELRECPDHAGASCSEWCDDCAAAVRTDAALWRALTETEAIAAKAVASPAILVDVAPLGESKDVAESDHEFAAPLTALVDGLMGFMLKQREAAAARALELSARLPDELTFVQLPDDLVPGIGRINIIELRAGARTLWRQWIELDGMTMRARSEWVDGEQHGGGS